MVCFITLFLRLVFPLCRDTRAKETQRRCFVAIKPLADRVLIEAADEKEEKVGSIYIPDTAKEKPNEGVVVEVGSGKITDDGKLIELQVCKGQKVLYGKYSGTEIKSDGKEYLIVRESDILAIIE